MKRAAPCLAALLLLASCQAKGPTERPLSPEDPRVASGLARLEQAVADRYAMRARARLSVDAPDLRFRRPQRLVVARPESLRVEVLGLFGQVAAILVTRDGRYQFFDPAQGAMEQGELSSELLWRLARVDLTPSEAADVLLGVPRPAAGLSPIAASSLSDGGVAVSLAGEGMGVAEQRFEFDALGQIRSAKRFSPDGGTIWAARFDDYRQLGDHAFAFHVSLSFPRVEATAEISFTHVELNPDLADDLFVLSIGGPVR